MSGKTILHSCDFDNGEQKGWGWIKTVRLCELVDDDLTGHGKCLATLKNIEPRADLTCPQRTLQGFAGRNVIVNFDLRVEFPPEGYVDVRVDAGRNNISFVENPVPNSRWQRYSIPLDLREASHADFDIVAFYRGDQKPTTRMFIDNITIESIESIESNESND
ncbi:hypothetical protein CP336_12900 [Pseudomonas fluorescens]|nr:hypothetical protein CP336_12900 [Pseudomonas fluorescens]